MKAIVTGAASGIGKATAQALVQTAQARGEAARLLMIDFAHDPLEAAAGEMRALGADVSTCVQDVSNLTVGTTVAGVARASLGGLDLLVSNAGTFRPGTLLDLDTAEYDCTFAVNTRATWLLAKACHPMLKDSGGAIIATASLSASEVTPNTGVYSASKAALVMLVQQMALEWGPDGIRCNCVSPGTIHTGMNDATYARAGEEERRGGLLPLRRIGQAEDVARVIAFLAGPDARYVTGVDIRVDGGLALSTMTNFWKLAAG